MEQAVRNYLAKIGSRGGKKSRRALSPTQSQKMLLIREARRAYRDFHARCFWSYSPAIKIGEADVLWVAEQLQKHGGAHAWRVAAALSERAKKLQAG